MSRNNPPDFERDFRFDRQAPRVHLSQVGRAVMASWLKAAMWMGVAVVPGGILVLLAWGLGRALWHGWRLQAATGHVELRRVFAEVTPRNLLREARAAF
jgi:hypothetical protein